MWYAVMMMDQCLNSQVRQWSERCCKKTVLFIHSLALKTTMKMVKVIYSTSSLTIIPDLLREMSGQLITPLWYQLMQSARSDQSPSTTTKTALKASATLIRMGHYSGRLDILIQMMSMSKWRHCCLLRAKSLWVWLLNFGVVGNLLTLTFNFRSLFELRG